MRNNCFIRGDESVLELERGAGCRNIGSSLNVTELCALKLHLMMCEFHVSTHTGTQLAGPLTCTVSDSGGLGRTQNDHF